MLSHADFHFIIGQIENRFTAGRMGCRLQCYRQRRHVVVEFFGHRIDFIQVFPRLGRRTGYFVKRNTPDQTPLIFGRSIGTGGNVSVRIEGEDALAITPSSMDYLALDPEDICIYSFDKEPIAGEHVPSVEMAMHIAVYRNRPDVNAVIHTHQPHASTIAAARREVPPILDDQAQLGAL